MLNVLHIGTDPEWRGGENQICQLGLGLMKRDVNFFVAYPEASHALPRFQQSFKCLALPVSRTEAVSALAEFARANKIDIIDANSSTAHKLALATIAQLTKQPAAGADAAKTPHLVVHKRVLDFPTMNPFRRAKYFSPAVGRFVAVSQTIEKILKQNKISTEKIALVRDGIDLPRFQLSAPDRESARKEWRRKLELEDNAVAVAVVAALTKEKGHTDFIAAFAHFLKRLEAPGAPKLKVRAFIAGRGPMEQALKEQAERAGLGHRIQFLGFVDNVAAFMNAMEISVLPSHSEALGSALIEATGAGCAVIGSDSGGIPEFVREGETGLIHRVGDHLHLAEQLSRLAKDPDLRARLQRAALKYASANFSVQTMCDETFRVYQTLSRPS